MCSVWETGAGWDWGSRRFEWNKRFKENMCLKVKFEQFEGGVALTCSLLVRWRQRWVIQRGGWPQGRGSARTLVAGGLPLSGEEAFMVTCFIFSLSRVIYVTYSSRLSKFTYQSDQALLRTTPLLVLWVSSPSCLQWVMCGFAAPPPLLPSPWWLHREGWGRCTCIFSNCTPSGPVWVWRRSGGMKQKPLSRNDFYCFSHCKCARSSSNSPQGFCCRCWILRESLVGSWSGRGCLEMESGLLWGATQALLSAALTLAGRSGKPLAWESPRPPQGLCRRKRGSAVMS